MKKKVKFYLNITFELKVDRVLILEVKLINDL